MIPTSLVQGGQHKLIGLRVASGNFLNSLQEEGLIDLSTPQGTLNTFLKSIREEDVSAFQACIAEDPNSKHLKRAKNDPAYARDLIEKLQLMPRVFLYQTANGEYRARTRIGNRWADVYTFQQEEDKWFIAAA